MTSRRSNSPTDLLVDLVTNTADPGYAEAAAGRGPDARPRWFDRPAIALGCLLVGFTLAIAYVHTHRSAPAAAKVHDDLVARVKAAQASGDALEAKAQRLGNQINQARAKALPGSSLGNALQRSELLAGETPATGPGLRVQLGNPPQPTGTTGNGRPGTTPITGAQLLTDRDVRSVVNELWHDGAEAISVNGVRLTPTSAIRFAGEAVLVDFAPITSPYTIDAIGDSDVLVTSFADSDVASRYHTLASAEGISFSWSEQHKLHLPGTAGVNPRYARPTGTTTTGPR
jgi:uncharacterized protein YlxW (UPF0749 family)